VTCAEFWLVSSLADWPLQLAAAAAMVPHRRPGCPDGKTWVDVNSRYIYYFDHVVLSCS
jgi:hypothetical protein